MPIMDLSKALRSRTLADVLTAATPEASDG
jgi:hypothetical protein